jgi:DNA-binding response OmpR family regulator
VKILLVEDDEALSDVIARNLRARGHQVVAEETAEAALLRMAETWPDVLVLDVNLPDLTGWDILRRLSPTDRRRLHTVVISAAPISQKRMDEFGPDHVLQKPFPIDALVRAIGDAAPARATGAEKEGV